MIFFCTLLKYVHVISASYLCSFTIETPNATKATPNALYSIMKTFYYIFLKQGCYSEGSHAYSLMLSGLNHVSACVDLVADILAVLEQLIQTVTLVNLRSRQHTDVQCSAWICECLLFLLVTNLTLWFQNSFYIEIAITRPGERYIALQHNELRTIGYIVHPISIFYRFHSSVCCVLAWYIFRTE